MARKRLYKYVFAPGPAGSGTVKVQGKYNLSDFLAIFDTTENVNIYNFADPELGGTAAYSPDPIPELPTAYDGITTLTLNLSTLLLNAADELAIYIEDQNLTVEPWAFAQDSIGRQRMSNPESLIDADFEYGLQSTKWQNVAINNNIPGFFEDTGSDLAVATNGYVSLISSTDTISSNVDTAVRLNNPGSPQWVANDFALIISQTQGNTAGLTSTVTTALIPSPQEREISVADTTGFAAGDNVLIIPRPTSGGTTIATNITSTATTSVVVTNAAGAGIVAGTYVIALTDTAGVYETMAVTSVSTNTLTVVRQTNGTNAGNANISSGNAIYVVPHIEIARVLEIADATTMDIARGWYNIPSVQSAAAGSIIQKLSPTNLELVQHTGISSAVNGSQTILRGQFNTTPLTDATAGSVMIRMTGVYATNDDLEDQLIAVNAPEHGIAGIASYVNAINLGVSFTEGVNIVAPDGFNTNNFSYYPSRAPGAIEIGFPLNRTDTVLRLAFQYTGAQLDVVSIVSDAADPSTLTVTTTYAHGLTPGTPLLTNLSAGTNFQFGVGNSFVLSVPTPNSFTYVARPGAAISGNIQGEFFVRSNATFVPRPFDGGVIMGPGVPTRGASAIRQTKKYFRYQSGKGILFTSGTMLRPTFDIVEITADGTTVGSIITVTTDVNHGLNPGAFVELTGINTSGYNVTDYVVRDIVSDVSFEIAAQNTLGSTAPELAPQPRVNVESWHGASIRAGVFDDQNGMFWECDGQSINAVQRSSTFQVAGLVSVGAGSNLVVGDEVSRFQEQLNNGDVVVIRGMTHTITSILGEQRMTVVPPYRGVANQNRVKMCLRQEIRVRQPDFNIDPLDGKGPSGYILDAGKMQMLGIEYSWYGAGYVQWMIRGQDGTMIPCHRRPNNNINYEAFMRSGNLPARYEAINETPVVGLAAAIDSVQTTITLEDATDYPDASVTYPVFVMIESEIIKYTGKNGNDLTGCTRGATFTQWLQGQFRSFTSSAATSHALNTGVILISNTCTPLVNHWGSSIIMDGGFDGDEGFQFTYNRTNFGLPAAAGDTILGFAMRLAPSVSNGIIGNLGERDLINRAALTLASLNVQVSAGRYLIEGILNPSNLDSANTSWQGLNNLGGGFQPSFSQFTVAPRFDAEGSGGLTGAPLNTQGGFDRSGVKLTFARTRTFANLTPAVVSSSGANGVISVQLTASGTAYNELTTAITVQNPGTGYAIGDTLRVLGNALGGTTPVNDLNLTVTAITEDIAGGERLFAIPVSATTQGELDLTSVKQIGTSAIPGQGTYPNGPEVLAVQITALTTQTAPTGDLQLSFKESQA
jgi:hypothetical protein